MFRIVLKKIGLALTTLALTTLALSNGLSEAATLNTIVMQEDWDAESLPRNIRIQNAVLTTFNQVLISPQHKNAMQNSGIGGINVFDETALTLKFYEQDRVRRRDEELITVLRSTKPRMDVGIFYTLYVRAVKDQYTKIVSLQMSINYRALDVGSGRFLGGDNLDLDNTGIPYTGCAASVEGTAADPHCVKEFVSSHGERLARNAGNTLAAQLVALLGDTEHSSSNAAFNPGTSREPNATKSDPNAGASYTCNSSPTTYLVTFRGFKHKQLNAVSGTMAFWHCAVDIDATDLALSEVTYAYNFRAGKQRLLRNIRLMMELIGQRAEPVVEGSNGIVVKAVPASGR